MADETEEFRKLCALVLGLSALDSEVDWLKDDRDPERKFPLQRAGQRLSEEWLAPSLKQVDCCFESAKGSAGSVASPSALLKALLSGEVSQFRFAQGARTKFGLLGLGAEPFSPMTTLDAALGLAMEAGFLDSPYDYAGESKTAGAIYLYDQSHDELVMSASQGFPLRSKQSRREEAVAAGLTPDDADCPGFRAAFDHLCEGDRKKHPDALEQLHWNIRRLVHLKTVLNQAVVNSGMARDPWVSTVLRTSVARPPSDAPYDEDDVEVLKQLALEGLEKRIVVDGAGACDAERTAREEIGQTAKARLDELVAVKHGTDDASLAQRITLAKDLAERVVALADLAEGIDCNQLLVGVAYYKPGDSITGQLFDRTKGPELEREYFTESDPTMGAKSFVQAVKDELGHLVGKGPLREHLADQLLTKHTLIFSRREEMGAGRQVKAGRYEPLQFPNSRYIGPFMGTVLRFNGEHLGILKIEGHRFPEAPALKEEDRSLTEEPVRDSAEGPTQQKRPFKPADAARFLLVSYALAGVLYVLSHFAGVDVTQTWKR